MDEWSKPVKDHDGGWKAEQPSPWYDQTAAVKAGMLYAQREATGDDGGSVFTPVDIPRDVVLRLLAAEASDRLGWVWEVDTGEWIVGSGKSMWGRHAETGEPITYDDHFGFTADDLVASLMGRFLLEDALREAGR